MKLIINDEIKNLAVTTITSLLVTLEQPEKGIAVAVNQAVITRHNWDDFQLSENDQVTLFQAIAGG
ncbi:sulfur carrier protein ThiS [Moritella viscosa]|uniref:ThiS protein n=1 Tax=Moritella viscosa TaxID=80854 RepID=A0A090IEV6_9GAMM|nr:sulfur carrier protein ThiS [Moritella viscosa]CED58259.1 thiamine biosynthesis protein ThiS [Moritella viscosa]SGY94668.1 ThiS protein [Moritella viscosa]SGY99774.1 ThiS protein [Moritella viscosa]SGZ00232.1 ThiS protein [Moritella viscosa]SGZ06239.1 ThiS protein [Moritella viscosa]